MDAVPVPRVCMRLPLERQHRSGIKPIYGRDCQYPWALLLDPQGYGRGYAKRRWSHWRRTIAKVNLDAPLQPGREPCNQTCSCNRRRYCRNQSALTLQGWLGSLLWRSFQVSEEYYRLDKFRSGLPRVSFTQWWRLAEKSTSIHTVKLMALCRWLHRWYPQESKKRGYEQMYRMRRLFWEMSVQEKSKRILLTVWTTEVLSTFWFFPGYPKCSGNRPRALSPNLKPENAVSAPRFVPQVQLIMSRRMRSLHRNMVQSWLQRSFDVIPLDKYDEYAYSQVRTLSPLLSLVSRINGTYKGHAGDFPMEKLEKHCICTVCGKPLLWWKRKSYCSKICCIRAQKHAMLIRQIPGYKCNCFLHWRSYFRAAVLRSI